MATQFFTQFAVWVVIIIHWNEKKKSPPPRHIISNGTKTVSRSWSKLCKRYENCTRKIPTSLRTRRERWLLSRRLLHYLHSRWVIFHPCERRQWAKGKRILSAVILQTRASTKGSIALRRKYGSERVHRWSRRAADFRFSPVVA